MLERLVCLLLAALWNGWLGFAPGGAAAAAPDRTTKLAPKPLYRDPVMNGAADPTVIWNAQEKRWFMFYTCRRANVPVDSLPVAV